MNHRRMSMNEQPQDADSHRLMGDASDTPHHNIQTKREIVARDLLVLLCSFCTALSYCDRVNMSVAIVDMSKEMDWSLTQRGEVLSAFFKGYVWSQIPGAYVAQKYGGHIVLGVTACLWSLATLSVPICASMGVHWVVFSRFCLGIAEGCVFPVIYHLFSNRIPKDRRSRSLASIAVGVHSGAVFSFIVSPILMTHFGWASVFYFFGVISLIWCVCWFIFYGWYEVTDHTAEPLPCVPKSFNKQVQQEEVEFGSKFVATRAPSLPLLQQAKKILGHKVVWAIFWCHFSHNVGTFVMMSWLPTYFEEAFHMGGSSLAISCVPYIAMSITVMLTSRYADRLISRGETSLSDVRRMSTLVGFVGAGTFMILITTTQSQFNAIFFMCIALACNGAGPVAGYEAAKLDVAAPEYVGRLQSISNTLAALAGVAGVPFVAYIKTVTGSWGSVFLTMGLVFYSAALVFHIFGHYNEKEKVVI